MDVRSGVVADGHHRNVRRVAFRDPLERLDPRGRLAGPGHHIGTQHERNVVDLHSRRIVVMTITSSDVERVFRESGALREGHFILASGRHSPLYLEKFQVLQHPAETERLCAAIAAWARSLDIETVAGPTTGGIILAHEVARQPGVRATSPDRPENGKGPE